jgi:predicted dehydrogenase
MGSKVLICGLGKMGKVHAKYLGKNGIDWCWYDPYIDSEGRRFYGDICNLDFYNITHVIIATPEETHYDLYSKIKDKFTGYFLIEKPVILNKENLNIFEDIRVFGGMVERFNPAIQALKSRIIPNNVVNIDFTRCSAAPLVSKANIFEDIGIHDLDLYTYLMGPDKVKFNLDVCSKTYCLTINKENSIARFIWSKETFFKERKIIVRQIDSTYMVDLQEQTLAKHYLDEKGRSIVEQIYVEKSSPVENEVRNFLEGVESVSPKASHQLMFEILGK